MGNPRPLQHLPSALGVIAWFVASIYRIVCLDDAYSRGAIRLVARFELGRD